MNKFLQGFFTALIIIVMVGCSSLLNNNEGIFGKSQAKVQKVDTKVQVINDQESKLKDDKLSKIGAYAKGGVEYSLDKIPATNASREVIVAKQMNERIEALANKPDFNEVKAIQGIVDDLTSQIASVRQEGENALVVKDKQITDLQDKYKQLEDQKTKEISAAFSQANEIAQKADQYQATLKKMDGFLGLNAIWYGLHKFFISSMWILGIGLVLFIILRLLAGANPIASAIFGIFEQAVACVIHTISFLFPKALSLAGNVSSEIYNGTKSALTSIVDSVETVKLQSNASGTPATIEELLNTAELSMTPADKALIEKIKLELGWIKPTVVPAVVLTNNNNNNTPTTGSLMPSTSSYSMVIPVTGSFSGSVTGSK